MTNLTPKQIVEALDRYIIGQDAAKRAVAVAIRNRWRRRQLPDELRQDVAPRNIIMSGPTGVGKTEIARRLAGLVGAPFIKIEATKFTEVGYFGRDVESIIRDLTAVAIDLVRSEQTEQVKKPAEAAAREKILDALLPEPTAFSTDEEARERRRRSRDRFGEQLDAGELEEREIEISFERSGQIVGMLGGQPGMEIDPQMQGMLEQMLPKKKETKRLTVADARKILTAQEAEKLVDADKLAAEAIERVEESGIVFLDEIDKVASGGSGGGGGGGKGPDVSRQGVQRDLLPIVEGSTVITKHGPVRTDHILFIAAGAFHGTSVGDLMPELQGRFPIRVELKDLTRDDFLRILKEPRNALTHQQKELLATEGLRVSFDEAALEFIAQTAFDVNRRQQNIGARRLYTIIERVFEQVSFDAPEMRGQTLKIDRGFVEERLGAIVEDADLSKFVL